MVRLFDIPVAGEGFIQRNLDPRQQVPAGPSGVQVHHGLLAGLLS
jgi:hypothetical protein